jgi:DNA-binding response OmpR family regulator
MKQKIMIVDDDRDYVAVNKTILEQNGYQVVVCHDPEECLARALAELPDLVVLDVMMGTQTDGFHVCHDLKNSRLTRQTPILMVSSVNRDSPFRFHPDDTWIPVDEFIEKPIHPEKLLEKIQSSLKRPRKD